MPGHNYTGPGNPLEKQLKHDSTGRILRYINNQQVKQML